jgi:hypothetical protein
MRLEAEQRIVDRVKALGFVSLADYIAARTGVPYTALADELGDGVLGMHVAALHMRDARDHRAAAADALVRALRQVLTGGWDRTDAAEPGVDRAFVNVTAWSYWTSLLDGCAPSENVLDHLWDELKARAQPGWLPTAPSDPVIVAAFDAAWPA